MVSVTTDRRQGINAGTAIKTPVKAASTANLTLSGEQTVDGVALVTDDRILVKDQTTGSENGVYAVNTSTWSREPDFDGRFDIVEGSLIPVNRGTANATTYWRVTNTGSIIIGTTALTFAVTSVLQSAVLQDGSVKMIADFSPNVDVTYNLGTALLQWVKGFFSGDVVAGNFQPSGDTASGDLASVGYNATQGLILTGQGSGNDVTIKNDADAVALSVPTGTINIVHGGTLDNSTGLITTNGQVVFPSVQNASADANTLDDYEELAWTPSVGGTATYTTQTGTFTKVGRLVTFQGDLEINSIGSGSTTVVTGTSLPAASKQQNVSCNVRSASATAIITCEATITTNVITLRSRTAASAATAANAIFQNATKVFLSGSYEV